MSMEQRNYLVTGVSRGLGIEIARALLEEEDVVVYGLSRSKPSELEALMARYPDRIRWMACDLGDSSNVRRVFKELVGALVVFGERLNFYQWIGVLMAVTGADE